MCMDGIILRVARYRSIRSVVVSSKHSGNHIIIIVRHMPYSNDSFDQRS